MITIKKAGIADAALLNELAKITLLQSHGHSAPAADMNSYIAEKYSEHILQQELEDPDNIYHILYYDNEAAGFSKIIFHTPCPGLEEKKLAKLERIYFLEQYHGLHLGQQLLDFIIALAKENQQTGLWLYVWTENERALRFYTKNGFVITGSHDFRISATHSNPNHQMLLRF